MAKEIGIGDDIYLEENGIKYYGKVVNVTNKHIYATLGDDEPIKFKKGELKRC